MRRAHRIVRCLAEQHDIAINTALFTIFDKDRKKLLSTDCLLDQSEVLERSVAKKQPPVDWIKDVPLSEAKGLLSRGRSLDHHIRPGTWLIERVLFSA